MYVDNLSVEYALILYSMIFSYRYFPCTPSVNSNAHFYLCLLFWKYLTGFPFEKKKNTIEEHSFLESILMWHSFL